MQGKTDDPACQLRWAFYKLTEKVVGPGAEILGQKNFLWTDTELSTHTRPCMDVCADQQRRDVR